MPSLFLLVHTQKSTHPRTCRNVEYHHRCWILRSNVHDGTHEKFNFLFTIHIQVKNVCRLHYQTFRYLLISVVNRTKISSIRHKKKSCFCWWINYERFTLILQSNSVGEKVWRFFINWAKHLLASQNIQLVFWE